MQRMCAYARHQDRMPCKSASPDNKHSPDREFHIKGGVFRIVCVDTVMLTGRSIITPWETCGCSTDAQRNCGDILNRYRMFPFSRDVFADSVRQDDPYCARAAESQPSLISPCEWSLRSLGLAINRSHY